MQGEQSAERLNDKLFLSLGLVLVLISGCRKGEVARDVETRNDIRYLASSIRVYGVKHNVEALAKMNEIELYSALKAEVELHNDYWDQRKAIVDRWGSRYRLEIDVSKNKISISSDGSDAKTPKDDILIEEILTP